MTKAPTRSLALEATVFWLIVGAINALIDFISASGTPFFASLPIAETAELFTGIIYIMLAYAIFRMERWALLGAIIIPLIIAVGTLVSLDRSALAIYSQFSRNSFIILNQLLIIFFAYRAYRETAQNQFL